MLYVQFDGGSGPAPETPPLVTLKVRRLADVFDGLTLRASEPAIWMLRLAARLVLGRRALSVRAWEERGLDAERGFALVLGARDPDGRWPVALSAHARNPAALREWLRGRDVIAHGDSLVTAGAPALRAEAERALHAAFQQTPATDVPYLELGAPLGRPGSLWMAATRRGDRFQAEMIARLPGLPPLHMIARDPPEDAPDGVQPALVPLGARGLGVMGPPDWSEPGPCDCGIPADECTMKRFRLTPLEGAPPSGEPGADTLRQLTAALIDLHQVRESRVPGVLPGDRVLVARSAESRATALPGDAVLDAQGVARPCKDGDAGLGPVLHVLPWPIRLSAHPFRKTFSGLW